MLKSERHDAIVALCDEHKAISVRELSQLLGISEMTARRDLDELAAQDRLRRVHGGAQSCSPVHNTLIGPERTHREKHELHVAEKDHAASVAASIIEAGDTIYLGTGTTIEAMVDHLPHMPLRIVTSSLAVFTRLIECDEYDRGFYDLHLIGGSYRKATMAFVGPLADSAMATLGVNKSFLGANGIMGNSVYGHTMDAGSLLQIAIDAADASYIVTDASKFGRRDFTVFTKLRNITAVITDPSITPEQRAEIEQFCSVMC